MRTPIRNPLGETKANSFIESLIPAGSVVSSYGFYCGSVEFYLSNRGRFISAHTTKLPVFEFWKTVFEDPHPAAEIASRVLPLKYEKDFSLLQEQWFKYRNPNVRAALFYLLNNCSSTGYVSKGEMDVKNYNPISLARLRKFIKPEDFYLSHIEDSVKHIMENKDCDIVFAQFDKYRKDILSAGINKGVEEEVLKLEQVFTTLGKRKFVFLTKPSKLLRNFTGCNIVFLDKYGRETDENNTQEIILHNV